MATQPASSAALQESSASERRQPAFAEFFAGIGLMRMGLEQAGWRCAFANDIDPHKQRQYEHHFQDRAPHFHLCDIHALNPAIIPTVELATASFPCTDLSLAGGRRGIHSGQSSAFWGLCRVLESLASRRPPRLLVENVTGLLSAGGGADLAAALRALNGFGYAVDVVVVDARWFVPQSRPRLFILGEIATEPLAENAWTLASPSRLRPAAVLNFARRHTDIAWRRFALAEPPNHAGALHDIVEPLADDDDRWWSRERATYLYQQFSPRHRAIADAMIAQPHIAYGAVFRRVRRQPDGSKRSMAELRVDGLAGCLRTPRGGSGRQILFAAGAGGYRVRLLTPRECARLMGADAYRLSPHVSSNAALFGFGDAVCVPAVAWLAEAAWGSFTPNAPLAEATLSTFG